MHYLLDIPAMIATSYVLGFLFYGFYRQYNARIQRRWGPSIFQNLYDNLKFLFKSETLSHGPMFFFGPMIIVSGAVTTVLFIPFLKDSIWLQGFSQHGNLILIIYLFVLGPLGNALAVGSSGNPFGVMGVTRGLTRLMGLEVPFFLGLALVMLQYETVSVHAIMAAQSSIGEWTLVTNPIAFLVILLPFIASMNAAPFDVVGAPQEVYAGPRVEFGGRFLGVLMTQNMMLSVGKLVLLVDLFLGGATNLFILIAKAFALFLLITSISAVFPRLKTEQAVDFFWKVPLGLGVVGVVATVWLQ
ncbi:respiratory chain complex I subunit 1 family protein [Thiococcus pfennigii]|jgi:NADH-quinone oxidoreductase subunit H|uniref:respiratory chain complex I subunit 1 family protein n=1 Tax=Thiococcus pfennigii TaxID=1057 RepID=UPI0019072090|nr:complex I subunit 1 family protein [Thiococcus pfennigii]MBK1731335.1 formate hydrogenlyase subunit 4 [Thiococcus pfennigii]